MSKNSNNEPQEKRTIGEVVGAGSQWISASALAEQRRVFDLKSAEIVDGKFGETIEFSIVLHGEFDDPNEANKKVSMAVNPVRMQVVSALEEGEFPNLMMKEVLTSKGQKAYTFVDYTEEEASKDTPF